MHRGTDGPTDGRSGPIEDAWARIRTWEPLKEGILSPSPLTSLATHARASKIAARYNPSAVRRVRLRL